MSKEKKGCSIHWIGLKSTGKPVKFGGTKKNMVSGYDVPLNQPIDLCSKKSNIHRMGPPSYKWVFKP